MTTPTAKPVARLAAELCKHVPLSDQAQTLLQPTHSVREYFEVLTASALVEDAIRVLAVGLPKPEAVWWACLATRGNMPKPWRVVCETALVASEKWVVEPTDANRRSAGSAAEVAGWDTPAGLTAAAAWLSGGSVSPPNLPVVAPREDVCGRSVAGALFMLAGQEPKTMQDTLKQFLGIGQKLASGQIKRGERG